MAVGDRFVAVQSGICPRCHTFIAKNSSRVIVLPRPERPRCTPDRRRSEDTGQYYYADGHMVTVGPRWLVHERCWDKEPHSRMAQSPQYSARR